jgi:ubiquinone/menaquinone biosynthesis C-methylase UbiE
MTMNAPQSLIHNDNLNIFHIAQLMQAPEPFADGTVEFWIDPYISQQMLKYHLDPDVEAASRPSRVILRTVEWLIHRLRLSPGDHILDLGCGPGLYARQFAERGLRVTGVDFSERSVDYARQQDPDSTYLVQNYLNLEVEEAAYDAVLLIYGDFCVLSPEQRGTVLGHVRRALKPGGYFAFDVTTPYMHENPPAGHTWRAVDGPGFWRPGPHLLLQSVFQYEGRDIVCHQYIVIEEDGTLAVYRNWFQDYTPESVGALLEDEGFEVEDLYGDLTGRIYTPDSQWIGVIARQQD